MPPLVGKAGLLPPFGPSAARVAPVQPRRGGARPAQRTEFHPEGARSPGRERRSPEKAGSSGTTALDALGAQSDRGERRRAWGWLSWGKYWPEPVLTERQLTKGYLWPNTRTASDTQYFRGCSPPAASPPSSLNSVKAGPLHGSERSDQRRHRSSLICVKDTAEPELLCVDR